MLLHSTENWNDRQAPVSSGDGREEGVMIVPMYVLVSNRAVLITPPVIRLTRDGRAFEAIWGTGYIDSARGQGDNLPGGTPTYLPPPKQPYGNRHGHTRSVPIVRDPEFLFASPAQRAAVGWISPMGYFYPPNGVTINTVSENVTDGYPDFRDTNFPENGHTYIVGNYVHPFYVDYDQMMQKFQKWIGTD